VLDAVAAGAAGGLEATAATSRPRSLHMKRLPGVPGGIVSSAFQPNRPV
jgi:hypothetical protein